LDLIYNFGVYDFNTPNFYTKFAQGNLLYKLDTGSFGPFFDYYKRQNRYVKEQQLALSQEEKQAIFNFLQNNAKPENRDYLYDFFYDNCATKIRDVLTEVIGDNLVYNNSHITENYSYRELIQKNVHYNTWGSFGMDVAIGAVVNRKAPPMDYQFLPEYIFKGAENATISRSGTSEDLVKNTIVLYQNKVAKSNINFFTSPLFIFGLIGLLILYITFKDYKNKKRSRYLDAILFFMTGLIGVFLLLLWLATDHSSTANNYNLLWAFPFNLLLCIAITKKNPKSWIRKYLIFLVLIIFLICLHWITGVQGFAIGMIPLLIALVVRYYYIITTFKK
jgi:succinate dehydrogenase/fumarate reductase cytochrome b subunit